MTHISCHTCLHNGYLISAGKEMFALAFHYICFTKIGCGSAKPRREQAPPLVFALAFHYICSTKTGGRPRATPATTDATYGTPAALCLAAHARPLTDDDDDRRAAAQGHRPRAAQHRRRAGLLQRQDRNRRDDVGRQRRAAPALVRLVCPRARPRQRLRLGGAARVLRGRPCHHTARGRRSAATAAASARRRS